MSFLVGPDCPPQGAVCFSEGWPCRPGQKMLPPPAGGLFIRRNLSTGQRDQDMNNCPQI